MTVSIIINDNQVEVGEMHNGVIDGFADSKAIFDITGHTFSVINTEDIPKDDPLIDVVMLINAGLYCVKELRFWGMNMDGYNYEYTVDIHNNTIIKTMCQGHPFYQKEIALVVTCPWCQGNPGGIGEPVCSTCCGDGTIPAEGHYP